MSGRALANLRAFLARVQLSGAEVPAFIEVMRWIEALEREADGGKADIGRAGDGRERGG